MNPVVTVLIDTYNHERFIEDAIRSALDQDFPRSQMEILVVDDGSTDRTPEIVRRFEPQVRLLRKANGGQASAINYGVAHSNGEFVAFLDGDDVWLPNKVSRVITEFQNHPEAVLVYHQFRFWDSRDGHEWETERNFVSGEILADRHKLLGYWAAPTSSIVFRRSVLNRLVPVPEQCSFNHDTYLITAAIFLGPIASFPDCLTKNRVHGKNLYFAGRDEPDRDTLRRRIQVRQASIKALRKWMYANAPKSTRPEVRFLVRRWQLGQNGDIFLLEHPGRFRTFKHRVQENLTYGIAMTRAHLAYRWAHATFELIVGPKHSHYLEAARSRARRLRGRFKTRSAAAERTGQTTGPAQ